MHFDFDHEKACRLEHQSFVERERRKFLMRCIGLVSERCEDEAEVPYQRKKKQLVKLLVNMIMAANLRGGEARPMSWTSSTNSDGPADEGCQSMRRSLNFAIVVILCMAMVMALMFYKLKKKVEEFTIHKTMLEQGRGMMMADRFRQGGPYY